jgi:hypothetical protein
MSLMFPTIFGLGSRGLRFHNYRALNPKKAKARVLSDTGFHWVQGLDLNQGPSGYEPDELPDCSTLQQVKHSNMTILLAL